MAGLLPRTAALLIAPLLGACASQQPADRQKEPATSEWRLGRPALELAVRDFQERVEKAYGRGWPAHIRLDEERRPEVCVSVRETKGDGAVEAELGELLAATELFHLVERPPTPDAGEQNGFELWIHVVPEVRGKTWVTLRLVDLRDGGSKAITRMSFGPPD